MCFIERFTEIYREEIIPRKKVRKCLFHPKIGTCRRVRVHDFGDVYPLRCVQAESPRMFSSRSSAHPRGRSGLTVETKTLLRPVRTYTKRTYTFNDQDTQTRRERVPRPFTVEAPETHRHNKQPVYPHIRMASPQRGRSRSPYPRGQEISSDYVSSPWNPRDQEPPRVHRRPRPRTPVSERTPLPRRQASPPPRIVRIHSERPRKNEPSQDDSPKHPRVHFYQEIRERFPRNEAYRWSNRSNFFRGNQEHDIIGESPSHWRHVKEEHLREPSPGSGRQGGVRRTNTTPNIVHIRPQIIQDGYQRMSRTGGHIHTEPRRKPGRNYSPWNPRWF